MPEVQKPILESSALETYGSVGNGAANAIRLEEPYTIEAVIEGTAPFLFHRWDCDAIEEKAKAAKGSKAKKSDDVETYVYRTESGELAIPGEYFRQAIIHAAKYTQDPRSPRKSAMDLFKAGIAALDDLCSLGTDQWDYLDRRRVLVQRNGVTRVRPAMKIGWRATAKFLILLPEYIDAHLLHDRLNAAGRLIGIGDFRPTFGRFLITRFDILNS